MWFRSIDRDLTSISKKSSASPPVNGADISPEAIAGEMEQYKVGVGVHGEKVHDLRF